MIVAAFIIALFGASLGRAISNMLPLLSSLLSTLIFVGLITDFLSRVSRALAASPLCKRFSVFNSIIRSSSSCCCCCLGSSSAKSASSSLDDLKLTLGATICARLLLDVERDFALPLVLLDLRLSSRRFCSSRMSR